MPLSLSVGFYLVAAPKPGDQAGIALVTTSNGAELGDPADVTVRPSGGPGGVGMNMSFTNIPDTYLGLSISVDEIDSTFTGLRLPASCPSPAADVSAHGRSRLEGVTIAGAKARSLTLKHGVLVVTLRKPAAGVTVKATRRAMRETATLKRRVRRHRVKSVLLIVAVKDAAGKIHRLGRSDRPPVSLTPPKRIGFVSRARHWYSLRAWRPLTSPPVWSSATRRSALAGSRRSSPYRSRSGRARS